MNRLFLFLFLLACQMANYPPQTDMSSDVQSIAVAPDAGADVVAENVQPEAVETAPIVEPKHQNILLIGDSEVRYVGWHIKSVQRPNETIFLDSIGGTTIGYWNFGVFHREMNKYPNLDMVIVFLGTNNFNFSYLQPHQNILDEIKARHVKCIWVGPTDVHMRGWTNPHIIGGLIRQAVSSICTYVDTESLHIPLTDGVHPGQEGAVKWLTEIWKVKDTL